MRLGGRIFDLSAMITVRNLSFTYPHQAAPTIKNIDFEVEKGEIFGFLGPSGAGKSTTQKVLIRLLRGFEGEARVMGKSLRDWRHDYYEHIGVGFELPNHYPKLTARENLRFFASFYDRPVRNLMSLLDRVGLAAHADKRVEAFSKGMKMRLNFVRALMHDPEILFLDEPTAGLDPANARLIKDLIRELKHAGKTIFLTTHHMHDAEELCDRVAFMADGEIRLIDTPAQLRLRGADRKVAVRYQDGAMQEAVFPLESLGNNAAFLNLIRSYPVESIHSCEQRMEEVFIEVTGKQLT